MDVANSLSISGILPYDTRWQDAASRTAAVAALPAEFSLASRMGLTGPTTLPAPIISVPAAAAGYAATAITNPGSTRIVAQQLTPRDATPRRAPGTVGPARDASPRLVRCSTTPRLLAHEPSFTAAGDTSAVSGALYAAQVAAAVPSTPTPVFQVQRSPSYLEVQRSPSYVPPSSQAASYVPPVATPPNTSYVAPVAQPTLMTQTAVLPPATTVVVPQAAVLPQVATPTPPVGGAPTPQMPAALHVQGEEQISLTRGLPDPIAIDVQKAAWSRRLDDQLRYEEELLKMQQKQQTALIHQAAEAQKRHAIMEIEQRAKQQELSLTHQCSEQMMGMQKELQSLKLMLEKQASDLLMTYQQRKSQEEILQAQFKAHRRAADMQVHMAAELQRQQQEARADQAALSQHPAGMSALQDSPTNGGSSSRAMRRRKAHDA